MLIAREKSLLLVVDMQTRLLPAISGHEPLHGAISWLIRAANMLGVKVIATEQYPQGLGPTDPALAALLKDPDAIPKVQFSCAASQCFDGANAPPQQHIILCGIEAHVCVLQTAIELARQGRQIFLVADAIGSRNENDKALAIERMRSQGIQIVSREMVAFEWLRQAGTDEFRAFSKEFLR